MIFLFGYLQKLLGAVENLQIVVFVLLMIRFGYFFLKKNSVMTGMLTQHFIVKGV